MPELAEVRSSLWRLLVRLPPRLTGLLLRGELRTLCGDLSLRGELWRLLPMPEERCCGPSAGYLRELEMKVSLALHKSVDKGENIIITKVSRESKVVLMIFANHVACDFQLFLTLTEAW